jgi:hypothetical protein
MLSAAQSRNESAARVAAQELAADFQNAISPVPLARPEAYAEDAEPDDDGGAAYDTLKNYNDGAAGAV